MAKVPKAVCYQYTISFTTVLYVLSIQLFYDSKSNHFAKTMIKIRYRVLSVYRLVFCMYMYYTQRKKTSMKTLSGYSCGLLFE